jgi:hypothetical protein
MANEYSLFARDHQRLQENLSPQQNIFPILKRHQESLKIAVNTKIYKRVLNDSFILGHVTLGRLRTDLNFEADCSDNGNHGTWNGTGISGSQYSTSGYRLSEGQFNGTDNTITSTGVSEASCRSICFFIKNFSNSVGLFTFSSGVTISVDGSGNVTTSGFTNPSVTETTSGDYTFVYIEFDAETLTNPTAGYNGSAYFDGSMDEILVFDKVLNSTEQQEIIGSGFDGNSSLYSNCKLWWSMDNPRLGDRRGAQTLVAETDN